MKKIFIIILCFNLSVYCLSQKIDSLPVTLKMELTDAFLVKLKIDTILTKIDNRKSFLRRHNYFNLCKISICKVIFITDTLSINKEELLNTKFMLIHPTENIPINVTVTASLYSSDMKNLLFFNRILNLDEKIKYYYKYYAVIFNVQIFRKNKILKYIKSIMI